MIYPTKATYTRAEVLEIDRNARAYGYEVGKGQELRAHIESSEDNPFLDASWQDKVKTGFSAWQDEVKKTGCTRENCDGCCMRDDDD